MLAFLNRLVTWWHGQTIGTQLFTWRKGQKVGEDDQGNIYYQTRDGKRRWVIFNGEAEASRVPPDWHGWLHHTYAETPTTGRLPHKKWEKPHEPNMTGTPAAYAPAGLDPADGAGGAQRLRGLAPGMIAPRGQEARMSENVTEVLVGGVVLAAAVGFFVYAGQVTGGGRAAAAMTSGPPSARPTGCGWAPMCGLPGCASGRSPGWS